MQSDTKRTVFLDVVQSQNAEVRQRRQSWKWLAMLAVLSWAVWSNFFPHRYVDVYQYQGDKQSFVASDLEFDWEKIIPSEILDWVPCFEEYQCSRLEVPLDYAQPHGRKAAIALVKYPSKYPIGDEKYRGPILYNPGGPGGSGVEFVRVLGKSLSGVIGDDYDHVGFDPRGVGHTTPAFNIFPSEVERKLIEVQQPPPINSTADALGKLFAYSNIIGDLALERGEDIASHLSTAAVSRDMLQITKAHGKDKLLYWGFSYGSVLGITYAAMFPNNVERLIVDGVVDTENYYEAAWSNNLIDADRDLETMLEACSASSECGLHEATPEAVKARLFSIFSKLRTGPIPVVNGSKYGIADWTLARQILFVSLYSPNALFPSFASAMAEAEKGDGKALYTLSGKTDSLFRCNCSPQPQFPKAVAEVTMAIACSEGNAIEVDLDYLIDYYAKMAEMSSFADMWPIHAFCSGWKIRASEIFSGPFVGNTSFPIMLIGNTADPVTPLWAAKKMSKGFKDAVVLTQNSPGHCSVSSVSLCTAKYVREYFRDGKLPPMDTVCEVDTHIFPTKDAWDQKLLALSTEDGELLEATRDLSQGFRVPMLGVPF